MRTSIPSFQFVGPSSVVDSGCSAGLLTMNHALEAMRTGQCDTALVTSVNMLLKPHTSMPFHRLSEYILQSQLIILGIVIYVIIQGKKIINIFDTKIG